MSAVDRIHPYSEKFHNFHPVEKLFFGFQAPFTAERTVPPNGHLAPAIPEPVHRTLVEVNQLVASGQFQKLTHDERVEYHNAAMERIDAAFPPNKKMEEKIDEMIETGKKPEGSAARDINTYLSIYMNRYLWQARTAFLYKDYTRAEKYYAKYFDYMGYYWGLQGHQQHFKHQWRQVLFERTWALDLNGKKAQAVTAYNNFLVKLFDSLTEQAVDNTKLDSAIIFIKKAQAEGKFPSDVVLTKPASMDALHSLSRLLGGANAVDEQLDVLGFMNVQLRLMAERTERGNERNPSPGRDV